MARVRSIASWAGCRLPLAVLLALFWLGSGSVVPSVATAEPVLYSPDESEFTEPSQAPQRPVCPEPPLGPYEGSDDAAGEIRLERTAIAETCLVEADRLGVLSQRLWWIVSEQLRTHDQGVALLEKLTALNESGVDQVGGLGRITTALGAPLVAEVSPSGEGPLPVHDTGIAVAGGESTAASESLAASVDASGEAMRHALWYLIGVAAGAMVFYTLYRQVMPRA